MYEDKLTVVKDCGLHDDVISPRMSEGVDKFEKVFSDFNLNKDNFFNSGVMMFHRNHKKLLKELVRIGLLIILNQFQNGLNKVDQD